MITKEFNGYCPEKNELENIDITFNIGQTTDSGCVAQKYDFECKNQNCDFLKNQDCPIFKKIPFISEISNK